MNFILPHATEQEYSVATTNDNLANTQGSQQPEGEDSDMPQDDLIARIASFVKKQIEEGLQPLRAALQTQEGEQKYRDRMLATQAGQLDVMRQEMQLVTSVLVNTMGIAESNGAQAGAATIFETDLDAALHADPYLSDEVVRQSNILTLQMKRRFLFSCSNMHDRVSERSFIFHSCRCLRMRHDGTISR